MWFFFKVAVLHVYIGLFKMHISASLSHVADCCVSQQHQDSPHCCSLETPLVVEQVFSEVCGIK